VLWSIISVVALIAGIGGLVWWNASREKELVHGPYPQRDPFLGLQPTPSQKATIKYFLVVVILWGVQILMGAITAHYGVEGQGFYGIPLDKYLPYAITRTWHLQIAIFWIATSWLATGLYVGPAVSGHEPKYQRLGVNVLFAALVLVVGGSLAGEWLGIQQKLRPTPLDDPPNTRVRKTLAQRRDRGHSVQHIPHRSQAHDQNIFAMVLRVGCHVQGRVSPLICFRISVVEWSFGSPTISTRPPYARTSSRSGTESIV